MLMDKAENVVWQFIAQHEEFMFKNCGGLHEKT